MIRKWVDGKAVLAHPGKVINKTNISTFKKELLRIINLGIDGIECYYPSHTEDITNICLEICEDRNLLITCGSDCHGEFENTEIGEMNIPIENLKLGDIFSMKKECEGGYGQEEKNITQKFQGTN